MPLKTNTHILALIAGFAAILVLNYFVADQNTNSSLESDAVQLDIRTNGPTQAYENLRIQAEGFSPEEQHTKAHIFGGALFNEVGIQGLSVCGPDFLYGCFHEFIGQAIHTHGEESIAILNDACITQVGVEPHFCQHGVGHGIQTLHGYSKKDFLQALAACGELPGNDPVGGCRGGIFMEYNFRTMLGADATERTETHPFELCESLKGDDELACAFWIPEWWYEKISATTRKKEEVFHEMHQLCSDFRPNNPTLTAFCMRGIGNVAGPQAKGDAVLARVFCGGANEQEASLECVDAAQEVLPPNKDGSTENICATFSTNKKSDCELFSDTH